MQLTQTWFLGQKMQETVQRVLQYSVVMHRDSVSSEAKVKFLTFLSECQ